MVGGGLGKSGWMSLSMSKMEVMSSLVASVFTVAIKLGVVILGVVMAGGGGGGFCALAVARQISSWLYIICPFWKDKKSPIFLFLDFSD